MVNVTPYGQVPIRLFHRTSEDVVEAILRDGFIGGDGSISDRALPVVGVCLSDVPFMACEKELGMALIEVTLHISYDDIVEYERVSDWHGTYFYREWRVPAELIAAFGSTRVVTLKEEQRMGTPHGWSSEVTSFADPRLISWWATRGIGPVRTRS